MTHTRFRNLPWIVTALALGLSSVALAGGFADPIETAHKADVWRANPAIQTDITVEFGGTQMIDGTLLTDVAGGHVRIDLENGTSFVFDGSTAWTSPADSEVQGGRFHVLTWSYFLLAPLKLQDDGTHLEDLGKQPYRDGKKLPAARLTFGDNVGDTPDDWYVLYRDRQDRLVSMAYIVTFGKDTAAAEKEPHAITYESFEVVDGAPVPVHWKFWNWTAEGGIHGDPIGEVKLSNPRFVTPAADAFTAGKDAREEALPGR